MKDDFRITYDGYWYRLQRYVCVWWLLFLGKSWQRVVLSQDGVEYGLWMYDNLKFKTSDEAKRYAERIEKEEQEYAAKEMPCE